jgi:hypothetical protein
MVGAKTSMLLWPLKWRQLWVSTCFKGSPPIPVAAKPLDVWVTMVASGAAASGVTITLGCPLIYVRAVLDADMGDVKQFTGMAGCLKKAIAEKGFHVQPQQMSDPLPSA